MGRCQIIQIMLLFTNTLLKYQMNTDMKEKTKIVDNKVDVIFNPYSAGTESN